MEENNTSIINILATEDSTFGGDWKLNISLQMSLSLCFEV